MHFAPRYRYNFAFVWLYCTRHNYSQYINSLTNYIFLFSFGECIKQFPSLRKFDSATFSTEFFQLPINRIGLNLMNSLPENKLRVPNLHRSWSLPFFFFFKFDFAWVNTFWYSFYSRNYGWVAGYRFMRSKIRLCKKDNETLLI